MEETADGRQPVEDLSSHTGDNNSVPSSDYGNVELRNEPRTSDAATQDQVDSPEQNGPLEGHEILELMMPTFSGNERDEFGRASVPPHFLLLDRISEGQQPASRAQLLNLPVEILALIVEKIHADALPSLALVNSDCRQLARSRQFGCLLLDYSDRTMHIIQKLDSEFTERTEKNGLPSKPALGPCIRRITVATHPGWLSHRHNIGLSEEFRDLPRAEQSKRLKAACDVFFGSYMPMVESLVSHRATLPHLERLSLTDRVTLRPALLNAIANSSVQQISLDRHYVDEDFMVARPVAQPSGSWPLTTLHLEVMPSFFIKSKALHLSKFCTSILQICAPTLECLTWADCTNQKFQGNLAGMIPNFPALRYLRLTYLQLADALLLEKLVTDKLNNLAINTSASPAIEEFFETRSCIPSLKCFVWANFPGRIQSLAFLEANPQINTLHMTYQQPECVLNDQILPLLTSSFMHLTSLSLTWDAKSISAHALEVISHIKTLSQLRLSAGFQAGWRHDWLIDHSLMRSKLSHLPLLRKLAFSRDSYNDNLSLNCESYYSSRCILLPGSYDIAYDDEFERVHRQLILAEAESYTSQMPTIEWLYFGQLPMAVEDPRKKKGSRFIRFLTEERDDCWTLLNHMFGWKDVLEE